MSVVPECEYELDDTDCDLEATHEVLVKDRWNPSRLDRGFVCAGHKDDVVAADRHGLVTVRDLDATAKSPIEGLLNHLGVETPNGVTVGAPVTEPLTVHDHSITVDCHEACPRWAHVKERRAAVEPVGIATVPQTKYRPSKWSTPWILLLGLIGYELWAVATSKPGGPLSHLAWWAYGDRWSLRWWLCSMGMNGLGVWAAAHFMFERWEVRELGICVGVGIVLGVAGWLFTR